MATLTQGRPAALGTCAIDRALKSRPERVARLRYTERGPERLEFRCASSRSWSEHAGATRAVRQPAVQTESGRRQSRRAPAPDRGAGAPPPRRWDRGARRHGAARPARERRRSDSLPPGVAAPRARPPDRSGPGPSIPDARGCCRAAVPGTADSSTGLPSRRPRTHPALHPWRAGRGKRGRRPGRRRQG